MVYKIPPGGGGKPYLASGLLKILILWPKESLLEEQIEELHKHVAYHNDPKYWDRQTWTNSTYCCVGVL